MTNMLKQKVGAIVFVTAVSLFSMAGSCKPPAFQRGIRVQSVEELADIANSRFPVAGVGNSGNLTSVVGAGTGTDTTFVGVTSGTFAISDYPNARTNANWQVDADFTPVILACGIGTQNFYVPAGGDIIFAICVVE
jgi:hypothetical protein